MFGVTNRDRVANGREHNIPRWLFWVLMAVFFTPPMRLPGEIPFRIDDLFVAVAGGLMLARWILRFRAPKLDWVSASLLLMAISMPLSAFFAQQSSSLPVGIKEYLDLIRPLKFLFLYLALMRSDALSCLQSLKSAFRYAVPALTFFALIQFIFLNPASNGVVARFFLFFTELKPEHARSFFGLRPFATFHTPTDLGYVMTLLLAASLSIPGEHKWSTRTACVVGLTLSNTRTFLFALPLVFGICAILNADTFWKKMTRLFWSFSGVAFVGVLIFYIAPLVNPNFSRNIARSGNALVTGDFAEDDSIAVRLHKLELVVYTWDHAKYFGVASRELLGPAADSEYVFTFHRYGLIGIMVLLGIYVGCLVNTHRLLSYQRDLYLFTILVLFTTFIYGFTQGALINTRTGVIPIAVIAIASKRAREAGLGHVRILTGPVRSAPVESVAGAVSL